MNEFAYLLNPLRFNFAARLKSVVTIEVNRNGQLSQMDILRDALMDPDPVRRAKRQEYIGTYFEAARQYTETVVAILGVENGLPVKAINTLPVTSLQKAREWANHHQAFLVATAQYIQLMQMAGITSINDGRLIMYSDAVKNLNTATPIATVGLTDMESRVAGCLAILQAQETGTPAIPPGESAPALPPMVIVSPVETTSPDPSTLAYAKLVQWRAALVDARRVETDAQAIIAALQSVRLAWVNAGDYPDQVRTIDGMIGDAVATMTWAQQAARTFASLISVAETIANTGVGTLPPDPVLGSVVPLPAVLPARPDGTVPVVTFTPATTVPTVADTGTPMVQGRKAGAFPILATLLTLITLFN